MSAGEPLVIANVGAEEGERALDARAEARTERVAGLFRALFGAARPGWLRVQPGDAFAWLQTPEALEQARRGGRRLVGSPPEVVARVHDKAFAQRVAQASGQVPAPLEGLVHVLEPEALRRPGAARALLEQVRGWPAWTGHRYTLKPRFGTSARGRVGGALPDGPARSSDRDASTLGRALPRLAERGGALLEPWLERRGDYSVQLFLDSDRGVLLLGSLSQCSATSGVVAGHTGMVDARGRVSSGSEHDGPLREAALQVALAALEAGYRGPCGVDAFSFAGPGGETLLRPVVELNARFTLGMLALAGVRASLPELRRVHRLAPGRLLAFACLLSPGAHGEEIARIASADGGPAPSLFVCQDPGRMAAWVSRSVGGATPPAPGA